VTERQSKETKDAEHLILLTFPQHFFFLVPNDSI